MASTSLEQIENQPVMKQALEEWERFCGLVAGEKMAIVYHGDMDGVVGAAYMRKAASQGYSVMYWVSTDEYHFENLRSWIRQTSPHSCIFADISIENSPDILKELATTISGQVLVYDHHYVTSQEPLPQNVRLINPTPTLRKDQPHIPTFVLAHMIAKRAGMHFPDWLLLLVMFSEGVEEFYKEDVVRLGRNAFRVNGFDRKTFKTTGLQRTSSLVRAQFSIKEKKHTVLNLISMVLNGEVVSFPDFKSLLEVELGSVAEGISEGISEAVDQWKPRIEKMRDEKVIFIPVHSPYGISGPIASILRGTFGDKIIVTYQSRGKYSVFDFRTRNDTTLNLPQLLKKVGEQVHIINSGGHPSAAGALLETGDTEKFMTAFEKEASASLTT